MKTRLKYFWRNHDYQIVGLSLMGLMIFGGFVSIYALDSAACSAKWGERGEYGFYSGCMVDGIPDKNIRILIGD